MLDSAKPHAFGTASLAVVALRNTVEERRELEPTAGLALGKLIRVSAVKAARQDGVRRLQGCRRARRRRETEGPTM